MKVLVIGGGGREHALCWKLKQSKLLKELYCAPGNPGIAEVAILVNHKVNEFDALIEFSKKNQIDFVIVGPDNPLADGIVDAFQEAGIKIFGPTASAARIEASKDFAKNIMQKANVPTAAFASFNDYESAKAYLDNSKIPVVLKADGLAFGKGVYVCLTREDANSALNALFNELKSEKILIEEFMTGREASYFVVSDGKRVVPLGTAHDYKRIFDNDLGPNTGGMGTVSPTPNLTAAQANWTLENVCKPVIKQMEKDGCPFVGFLYAGLMIDDQGNIKVIEFNSRFGDPEAQSVLPRMTSDLLELLLALMNPESEIPEITFSEVSAVCVVLAAPGYPDAPKNGQEIHGLDFAKSTGKCLVFQAGTKLVNNILCVAGGRVINVVGFGSSQTEACANAYRSADMIQFEGVQLRRDIGKIK